MHTNRLIQETSPYLLQHAHNPVDWYPWGPEAFEKAAKEDKPVLVSIGYAACHWCHVMEKESFEDEATASLMNREFVNIKVDREERPDLDHIYMDAVQAISGSGGWPLNVFLTPERKPFYGGTYFPPLPLHNRASWTDVLQGVAGAFRDKRHQVNAQSDSLIDYIRNFNQLGLKKFDPGQIKGRLLSGEALADMLGNVQKTADTRHGGFGTAPKFPQTFTIRFLLHHYYYFGDESALAQALLSLDKMISGGINDQIGGGFARYSTDERWFAPHFEKMLYDNALIVMALSEALQAVADPRYLDAITSTLDFVERELLSPEGGYYSSLDADSEGVEGKFYTWTRTEIDEELGGDAAWFSRYYHVSDQGNWEHTNILHVTETPEAFATGNGLDPGDFAALLHSARQKLLLRRGKRERPVTDDKILLGWNAMMNAAYSKAFMATGDEKYRLMAIKNMEFLLTSFRNGEEGGMFHTFKNGQAKYAAFLDDYAQLIHALILLQEISSDQSYLEKVKTLIKWVIVHFGEPERIYFYFTDEQQDDVIVRKKEFYDGAVPSGNSLMAWNLYYSGVVFDCPDWRERAVAMCAGLTDAVINHPGSFGVWAMVMQGISEGVPEIAVTGGGADRLIRELLRIFIPFRVLQSSPFETTGFPLLAGKPHTAVPMIWLCRDYSCQTPVNEVSAFQKLLKGI